MAVQGDLAGSAWAAASGIVGVSRRAAAFWDKSKGVHLLRDVPLRFCGGFYGESIAGQEPAYKGEEREKGWGDEERLL